MMENNSAEEVSCCVEKGQVHSSNEISEGYSNTEIPEAQVHLSGEIPEAHIHSSHSSVEIPEAQVHSSHSSVEIPEDHSKVLVPKEEEISCCVEKGKGHSSAEIPEGYSRTEIPEAQVHSSHSRVDIPELQGHSSVEIPEVQDHSSVEIPEVQDHSSFKISEFDSKHIAYLEKRISHIKTVRSEEPADKIGSRIFPNCDGIEEAVVGPHYYNIGKDLKFLCFSYVINLSGTNLSEYWQRMLQYQGEIQENFTSNDCPKCGVCFQFNCKSMIVDGCFILEFFRFQFFMSLQDKTTMKDHPIAQVERRKIPIIFRDLLQLGNQIPFLVLEQLFQICHPLFQKENDNSLTIQKRLLNIIGAVSLDALGVGRDYVRRFSSDPERFESKFGFGGLKPLHLLDLIRLCFNLPHLAKQDALGDLPQWNIALQGDNIPCISKLRLGGIKVSHQNRDHYLDVTFQAGAIKMPRIILNYLMCSFLSNCVNFEHQYKIASKHISSYVLLLDCLVDTADDIGYLRQRRVLEHHKKTDGEFADFINNLGTEIIFDGIDSNYFKVCRDVNKYYLSEPRRKWASFKSEYIEKPWLVISVLAASVLLILTCIQTYYAIHPRK